MFEPPGKARLSEKRESGPANAFAAAHADAPAASWDRLDRAASLGHRLAGIGEARMKPALQAKGARLDVVQRLVLASGSMKKPAAPYWSSLDKEKTEYDTYDEAEARDLELQKREAAPIVYPAAAAAKDEKTEAVVRPDATGLALTYAARKHYDDSADNSGLPKTDGALKTYVGTHWADFDKRPGDEVRAYPIGDYNTKTFKKGAFAGWETRGWNIIISLSDDKTNWVITHFGPSGAAGT